jgi:hypothetical protein
MRALRRTYLASLLLIAAIGLALGTTVASGVSHSGSSLADCPAGTNWDYATQSCH